MKPSDICIITWITVLSIVFVITMLSLAWAIFEDTEIGEMITERFKERWKDDA